MQVNTSQSADDEDSVDDLFDKIFDGKGFWHAHERPVSWAEPATVMQNEHFWQVFDSCLNNLPAQHARVFMMRQFLELESDEICENLRISTSNLHVLLYRARLGLRECLENNWFTEGERS